MTELDAKTRAAAIALVEAYATALDERRFDDWLALFADDAAYTMLLAQDDEADTNLLAIGENKTQLAGRIEVGRTVERQRTTHLLSAITPRPSANNSIALAASFAVIRQSTILAAGRYRIELDAVGGALRIRRCTVVLDNELIVGTIYLPI